MQPYKSNSTATAEKKTFISSGDNIFIESIVYIAVHDFLRRILTSFYVDEILLPSYAKCSTDFIGLQFNVDMIPSCLKHMNSALSEFTLRPMPFSACLRL